MTPVPFPDLELSDPLTFPFVWGGSLWGDEVLDTNCGTLTITFPGNAEERGYLNLVLDTVTDPTLDNLYPSWGTFTITSPLDRCGGGGLLLGGGGGGQSMMQGGFGGGLCAGMLGSSGRGGSLGPAPPFTPESGEGAGPLAPPADEPVMFALPEAETDAAGAEWLLGLDSSPTVRQPSQRRSEQADPLPPLSPSAARFPRSSLDPVRPPKNRPRTLRRTMGGSGYLPNWPRNGRSGHRRLRLQVRQNRY